MYGEIREWGVGREGYWSGMFSWEGEWDAQTMLTFLFPFLFGVCSTRGIPPQAHPISIPGGEIEEQNHSEFQAGKAIGRRLEGDWHDSIQIPIKVCACVDVDSCCIMDTWRKDWEGK